MIRVLVLTDTNVGDRAGAEQHLETLISRLDYSHFSVHVIQLGRFVPQEIGPVGEATISNLPTGKLISLHGIKRLMEIHRHIRRSKYDCVISFFESSDLISAIAGSLGGVGALISSRRDTGFRHSSKLRWAYRWINPRFSRIVAASDAVRQSLLESGVADDSITVIYNGVDPERFENTAPDSLRSELEIPSSALILGMVANLSAVKDHATVIDCLSGLHRQDRRFHLVLAGDGALRVDLEKQVVDTGLEPFVHFLGRRSDVPTVLAGFDIFVLSSLTEGLSNSLLEAMASGKPVIATRVGGNPEVVVDGVTGVLIPPKDLDTLAREILRLADNPDLRIQMGQAGYQRVVEKFSIDAMVNNYVKVIDSAVSLTT